MFILPIMKIRLLQIGKTNEDFLVEGIKSFEKRIQGYITYSTETIANVKNAASLTPQVLRQKEAELILAKLKSDELVILLDEQGKEMHSRGFAEFMQQQMNLSVKQVTFIIGGAFGFSDEIYQRANRKISLSKMTFSHQLIRLIFAEQLYRCFSIINNHHYNND